jgi:hypothetical protein
MKRPLPILVFLLTAKAVLAQEAPVPVSLPRLALKNIFDPSRSGRARYGIPLVRPTVIRNFTFRGTIDDTALVTGDGTPSKGYVRVGDTLDGFTVRQVTMHFLKLSDPTGRIVILKTDDTMRREDEGPWTLSDLPPPTIVASADAGSASSTLSSGTASSATAGCASSSAGAMGDGDILKRLRLKREQEDK